MRSKPPDALTLAEAFGRRMAIWGMGQEGLALASLAARKGIDPVLIDDQADASRARVTDLLGADRAVLAPDDVEWAGLEVVVRSPGVSRYRPELEAARREGVVVTTTMALWLEDHGADRVLAVTGTKGKSTTATLAAAVLEASGWQVDLVGNIGVPVVETYDRPAADITVVEVSSYQAAEVTRSPQVAVLTSLAPDHLDWHGGVEPYYRDKLRLIEAVPPGQIAVSAASSQALSRTAAHPHRTLYGPEGRVVATSAGIIEVDGTGVADVDQLNVPGRHNVWNLCGALAGVLLATEAVPSSSAVANALAGFSGLASRCHEVGVRDGRTYVDDALASNPFATATSIEAFAGRGLTVILGGADRGVDPAPLIDALAAHRPSAAAVVLPPEADRLAGHLSNRGIDVTTVQDLAEAVAAADRLTPAGGVVLFSPGAPTPPGGGGYSVRSRAFIEAARVDTSPGGGNGGAEQLVR